MTPTPMQKLQAVGLTYEEALEAIKIIATELLEFDREEIIKELTYKRI